MTASDGAAATPQVPVTAPRSHRLLRLRGRDPAERGRASSPLELLFDLTFVIAVGVATEHLTGMIAAGETGQAILAFVFAMFAILVGWINFSWFASAFDTDDWGYRIWTMVQMFGVVVLALGLPATFHSIEVGDHVDVRMMVAGYVVMRIGMVALWLRAARGSSTHRHVALLNASWILLVQALWVVVALVDLSLPPTFIMIAALGALELAIPALTQGRADGTPWHPHHIADRYRAFAIIALGEGVVGAVASSRSALGGAAGDDWSLNAAIVVVAGIGLTFAMWWTYFVAPFGELLHHRPRRGYLFGYGHIPVFMAIAATGAGLQCAGLYLAGGSRLSEPDVVLAIGIPVAVYLVGVYGLYSLMFSRVDLLHVGLLGLTIVLLALATIGSVAGLGLPVALLIVMLAMFLSVIGYETIGHRHQSEMIRALARTATDGEPPRRLPGRAR